MSTRLRTRTTIGPIDRRVESESGRATAAAADPVVSLYAGLVWDACRAYLAPGGLLLANASHGDASVAALDPDIEPVAAIRRSGRGIAYTRDAFAYVFRLAAAPSVP
ncbi:hypothetical protein [Aquipuribacter nitratireducens]|uniref:Uncharacterized protein n=1 Tax=Aquipuribacter nitratireducens TaxID=650104 RepID=A0ABW0GHD9_9MICO